MQGPIGVLGGIFDPVHNGHLALAFLAKDHFKLDEILIVPSGSPPHKCLNVNATAQDRLVMLKLALSGSSGLTIFEDEINRPGISYTVDTLRKLKQMYHGRSIYFLIGSDNLHEIPGWYKYREILELAILCVAHRPGYTLDVPSELNGTEIKEFPSPEWGISSSMVRSYLAKGYSCRHLLPDSVIDYILDKGLYSKESSRNDFK